MAVSIPEDLKKQILAHYMETPERRAKLAESLLIPSRSRLDFAVRAGDSHPVSTFDDLISIGDQILSVSSDEEKKSDVYCKLRCILGDLKGHRDHLRKASCPV